MSATNKTPLGLNQWVSSDKPVMAAFNEDNQIIDERIRELQAANVVTLPIARGGTGATTAAAARTALGIDPAHLSLRVIPANLNDWLPSPPANGVYYGESSTTINAPAAGWWRYIGMMHSNPVGWNTILAFNFSGNDMRMRTQSNGNWGAWARVASFEGNFLPVSIGGTGGSNAADARVALGMNAYIRNLVNSSLGLSSNGGVRPGTGDNATGLVTNIQMTSWFGIGFAPTFVGSTVPQWENAVWINARHGTLNARGAITANQLATVSDMRDKHNISDIKPNALEFINKLRPRQYVMDPRINYIKHREITEKEFEALDETERRHVGTTDVYSFKDARAIEFIETGLYSVECSKGRDKRYCTDYLQEYHDNEAAALQAYIDAHPTHLEDGEQVETTEEYARDQKVVVRKARFLPVQLESDRSRVIPKMRWGFIAQEAEKGALSAGIKDCPAIDIGEDGEYLFNYSELIAPLVASIQQLTARVEQLEAAQKSGKK